MNYSIKGNKYFIKKYRLLVFIIFSAFFVHAQHQPVTIKLQPTEKWFGSNVVDGSIMPFKAGYSFDMNGNVKGNQAAPLLLSTTGRYVWNNAAFAFNFSDSTLVISNLNDSLVLGSGGNSLAAAFRAASKRFFPPSGRLPDQLLFSQPQYNTCYNWLVEWLQCCNGFHQSGCGGMVQCATEIPGHRIWHGWFQIRCR